MTIDAAKLLDYSFETTEHTYTARDAMLYALGVGLGSDPTDETELPYVYERNLTVLPTMAAVIGHPGPWFQDPVTGIDWVHVVHGEQSLELHTRLHPDNAVRCETQVVDVEDKGPDRGALVRWRRRLFDAQTGDLVATCDSTLFCRKDGGFGGPVRPKLPTPPWPDSAPTASVESELSPRAALIYRLSGDYNPVHADPKIAIEAGFQRPILHGLCTFANATWSVIRELAGGDVAALKSVQVRFKAPVFPGQRLRTDMWQDGDMVRFRSFTDGSTMVLDGGLIELRSERGTK